MAPDPIVTKPLPQLNDLTRGNRLEIDEFIADNAMTNLFLLALAAMQEGSLEETNGSPNWMKYYALAGIHWDPGDDWDDVIKVSRNPTTGKEQKRGNYCHHGEPTFPTWHRPYMILYETAVYEEMIRQAKGFNAPWRETYLDAAARFRLPYWDPIMPRWDKDASPNSDQTKIWGCPRIFLQRQVYVRTPGDPNTLGEPGNKIQNPLYSFKFPTESDRHSLKTVRRRLKFPPAFNENSTERHPSNEDVKVRTNKQLDEIEGISYEDKLLDAAVRSQAANLATKLWQMLHPVGKAESKDLKGTSVQIDDERDWNEFANHFVGTFDNKLTPYTNVSIESWHDQIHGLIGFGHDGKEGHMGNPRYAGFEPMFWMHHNNIDRLLSLYQALYPQKYNAAFPKSSPSLVQLLPFRKVNGTEFYTSADPLVSDYRSPGFAMPGDVNSSEGMKDAVEGYLLKTYYWATNLNLKGVVKPTTSLDGWPKRLNIEASEALQGNAAKTPETFANINALIVDNGVAKLAARKVSVTGSAILEETPIPIPSIVQAATAIDNALPDGTFQSKAGQQRDYMPTWNAHVTVRKYAFDGSFAIHLFIGDIEGANPNKFLTRKNEAGYTFVFAASGNLEGCDNCKKQHEEDVQYLDVIPLTTTLYDYLDAANGSSSLIEQGEHRTIADLTPSAVVPFLTEQLSWRIVDLGSQLIEGREREAKLEIMVTSREFVPPSNEDLLGSYGPPTPYIGITQGKAGGYGHVYA